MLSPNPAESRATTIVRHTSPARCAFWRAVAAERRRWPSPETLSAALSPPEQDVCTPTGPRGPSQDPTRDATPMAFPAPPSHLASPGARVPHPTACPPPQTPVTPRARRLLPGPKPSRGAAPRAAPRESFSSPSRRVHTSPRAAQPQRVGTTEPHPAHARALSAPSQSKTSQKQKRAKCKTHHRHRGAGAPASSRHDRSPLAQRSQLIGGYISASQAEAATRQRAAAFRGMCAGGKSSGCCFLRAG
mmetsp:Transcript_68893/g.189139  ORF Transcript_68893/g.189139 Transcript_68893/m.189139 type:complete len:246 (-) Transcript_68893:76-813(-)